MSYNENYLMHHGVKGMKWGVRRYRNYDGTLTNAGKAQRKAEGAKEDARAYKYNKPGESGWKGARRAVKAKMSNPETKKKLKTAAKVAAGVAGAAAVAGGAYYLAKSGKGAKMLSAVGSAPRGVKALPAKGQSSASVSAASRAKDIFGKAGGKVKGGAGKVGSAVTGVAGKAKTKVQDARDFRNIRKASAYKRKYGVNALPGSKTSTKDRLVGAASNLKKSAKARSAGIRDTLDNASRGIDDGTRLGRAASAVGAAGQRAKKGASNLRDRAAASKGARYRKKYGVNALPGATSGTSARDRLRSVASKAQGRAANATRGARTVANMGKTRATNAARTVRDTATKGYASAARKVGGNKIRGTKKARSARWKDLLERSRKVARRK